MRPFHYSRLQGEDELEVESHQFTNKTRLNKIGLVLVISLLFLVSLPVASAAGWMPRSNSEWVRANSARATGDEYLLGVGKADITGYSTFDLFRKL